VLPVIIPAPQLGDQVKNATMFREANAAVVLDEARIQEVPTLLEQAVKKLLTQPKVAKGYATRLGAFAKPDAAADVASLVVSAAVRKQGAAKAVRSRKVRS
jgi:UDP-N-acetylglucosamine:LPS N-acetylglucosamine transferase